MNCSYCGKICSRRCWISFVGTCQCHRLICRLRSGHLLWWYTGRKLAVREFDLGVIVIRYLVLTKKGIR